MQPAPTVHTEEALKWPLELPTACLSRKLLSRKFILTDHNESFDDGHFIKSSSHFSCLNSPSAHLRKKTNAWVILCDMVWNEETGLPPMQEAR